MSWFPGWDTISGADWWSDFWFWGSIVALIALGMTEVVSHRYGLRKDELAATERRETDKTYNQEIARLHRQTADINAEAGKANERAASLEKEAAEAKERTAALEARAADLSTDAANARAKIAEAQARAAEATDRARQAELALAQFKAPRSLSPEQQRAITEATKGFPGVPYDFSIEISQECIDLMEQIASALSAAGWQRKAFTGSILFSPTNAPGTGISPGRGVVVQISSTKIDEWGRPLLALWNALKAADIATEGKQITDESENANAIHIYIGAKPQ